MLDGQPLRHIDSKRCGHRGVIAVGIEREDGDIH